MNQGKTKKKRFGRRIYQVWTHYLRLKLFSKFNLPLVHYSKIIMCVENIDMTYKYKVGYLASYCIKGVMNWLFKLYYIVV